MLWQVGRWKPEVLVPWHLHSHPHSQQTQIFQGNIWKPCFASRLSSESKKRFPSDDTAILNINSQSLVKSVFLYKIGVERERIVAIKVKQNIFSFLLLLAPGFEPLHLAARDGLPLVLAVSWETSSSTSGGGQQPDLHLGCPRRALGSTRRAGLLMPGPGGRAFAPPARS